MQQLNILFKKYRIYMTSFTRNRFKFIFFIIVSFKVETYYIKTMAKEYLFFNSRLTKLKNETKANS